MRMHYDDYSLHTFSMTRVFCKLKLPFMKNVFLCYTTKDLVLLLEHVEFYCKLPIGFTHCAIWIASIHFLFTSSVFAYM